MSENEANGGKDESESDLEVVGCEPVIYVGVFQHEFITAINCVLRLSGPGYSMAMFSGTMTGR